MTTTSRRLFPLTLFLSTLLMSGCAQNAAVRSTPDSAAIVRSDTSAQSDAGIAQEEPQVDDTAAAAESPATPAPIVADTPATQTPAAATDSAQDPRTDAERDFDALYGEDSYNPIADPTLPAPAEQPASYDPWEKFNRRVHSFNNGVDRFVAKPLAKAYVKVVPRPMRLGVTNFFNNLGQPVSAINALLQGKPKQSVQSLGRFLLNSTIGIGGLFDPATAAKIPNKSEDFGQTLGVWGWKKSRFVELPLFGPRTVRDAFGIVGDGQLSPLRQVELDRARVFLQGLQLVDVRTQLFAVDGLREGATDEYALVRDSWLQRRNYQINGDRKKSDDSELPDYLRDEDNPTVPADVMPIIPGSSAN